MTKLNYMSMDPTPGMVQVKVITQVMVMVMDLPVRVTTLTRAGHSTFIMEAGMEEEGMEEGMEEAMGQVFMLLDWILKPRASSLNKLWH